MANQESLTQWIYTNRHKLFFSAKDFDWAQQKGVPLFDFEVRLTIDGYSGVGRGSDFDQNTAFSKGVAEAVERAVCASLKISTTGVAAHTTTHLARANARLEALERYAFKTHLENEQKFIPLQAGLTKFLVPGMRFFRMGLPHPYHAVICFLSEGSESFLGLACDVESTNARDKAALEVLRNYTAFQSDADRFRQAVKEDPNLWSCQRDFLADVQDLLGIDENENSHISLPIVMSERILTSHLPMLEDCPLVLERAYPSEKYQ
jgi:ribosomal protein S12 methylthiotransferase accessory factor YcaO